MPARKFVLGDVHGQFNALKQVFERSGFDPGTDKLIQVGDLCDRGPDSYEVVELLKTCKDLVLIEGNHDQWLKDYIRSGAKSIDDMWKMQGAETTLSSYKKNGVDPSVHAEFYDRQVPYYIDELNRCFVHGGFDPFIKISEQDPEGLAWDRTLVDIMMTNKPVNPIITADKFSHIFVGHTPTVYWKITVPVSYGGITNMDTGAGKGGPLTIMDLDSQEFWQSGD